MYIKRTLILSKEMVNVAENVENGGNGNTVIDVLKKDKIMNYAYC